jgi:hypothetical protein
MFQCPTRTHEIQVQQLFVMQEHRRDERDVEKVDDSLYTMGCTLSVISTGADRTQRDVLFSSLISAPVFGSSNAGETFEAMTTSGVSSEVIVALMVRDSFRALLLSAPIFFLFHKMCKRTSQFPPPSHT